jgi:transcriptional regulator with XRE-family HTH domain
MTKKEYLRRLGANVRKVRESKGFSQDRACLEGELSRATMSRIEAGKVDPQAFTLHRIAKTIGVPTSRLLDFE